ncbi:uncharacterized protein FIBRA_03288 [Fibroporia radiculosa]|uniref:ferric-chelate reductase (NADPH) n=1 Tax=Fibroporia radiculosa TaxID=599839 RepID=J4H2B6_9APHY|nr:uncharacterized protein FIBRA_03288 [Fibroporia radiculosa]CCM01239.1 predicted protein [Fibroporia radiculosa]
MYSLFSRAVKAATFSQATLVLDVDVALFFVACLFILLALPRAVARYSTLSAWTEGSFFRSVKIRNPVAFRPYQLDPKITPMDSQDTLNDTVEIDLEKGVAASDDSHSDTMVEFPSQKANMQARTGRPPIYMPAWSTMFPGVAYIFSIHIRPGYSLGMCLLFLAYLAGMLYASLYKADLFTTPSRLGYVAVSQFPLIYILATKNNIVGGLIGMGYEKLNVFHRFAGRFAILAVNLHALAYFAKWAQTSTIASHMDQSNIWGCVALGGMDVLFLVSLTPLRQAYYQLFYVLHVAGAVVALVAVVYHEPAAIPYVILASVAYGVDRVVRLVQTRITTAHVRALPELGTTRLEIPTVNAGWRAGQHVRIKVLSMGMGPLGCLEGHPFTIASVSKSRGEEGLVLMIKKAGDWTTRLFELAQKDTPEEGGAGRKVKVLIQGPYGGPGHAVLTSFSGAMLIAGGSGITYPLSTLQEMIQKGAEGASRVRVVELVWSITDPAALGPMMPQFRALLAEAPACGIDLRISVSYTRAIRSQDVLKPFERLPPGLTLSPGRPRLAKLLEGVVDRTSTGSNGASSTGVVVGVCGPLALGAEASKAVRQIESAKKREVGGVELHEEYAILSHSLQYDTDYARA